MKPIYLDYNATTPVLPEVAETMQPYLSEFFGNPSSTHWYGQQTKKAIEVARKQVADLLGCHTDEIIFTSGGSEANNYAIKGIALSLKEKGKHIITSQIEHPAVMEVCAYLANNGYSVTYLPVNSEGLVDPDTVKKAITDETILITIMHANNEVGTIQPLAEISAIAHENDIIIHTDAAQSVGKIFTLVEELGVDMLSVAGHKLYAPKGIGALYLRRGINLEKMIHGADHERNLRAGTENVLEIVGLGKACELAKKDIKKNILHMQYMRDRLFDGLRKNLDEIIMLRVNGDEDNRLPNTLSISFPNIEANTLLAEIEDRIAASAGAACHSDNIDISTTLTAMKVPVHYAMGTIRLSTGKPTTRDEIDQAVKIISEAIKRLAPSDQALFDDINPDDIKLTHFTHGLGCACKLRPQALEKILAKLPLPEDKNILIGTGTADDAAVYRIDSKTAVVLTVDFFTPIVDDPFDFGQIAAANALSDVYAMGARPLFALNIVGFPSNRLPMTILERILDGARQKADEAGIAIIGGHTIDDIEPKYGMVVCGTVHPEKVLSNAGAKTGNAIILTKPLGTGILTTALKRGLLSESQKKRLTKIMSDLNKKAAEIMAEFEVSSCTDVTGFGLLGHLKEMSSGSKLNAEIDLSQIPKIEPVMDMAAAGVIPGGTENNLKYIEEWIEWPENISPLEKYILCDAQTSGGLLISIGPADAAKLIESLHNAGVKSAALIGRFIGTGKGKIKVI
jgi:cysteine desulfurase